MSKFDVSEYVRMTGNAFKYTVENVPPAILRSSAIVAGAVAIVAVAEITLQLIESIAPAKVQELSKRFFHWVHLNHILVRPFEGYNGRLLVTTAVASGVYAYASWQGASMLFGSPGSLYNSALRFTPFKV